MTYTTLLEKSTLRFKARGKTSMYRFFLSLYLVTDNCDKSHLRISQILFGHTSLLGQKHEIISWKLDYSEE